MKKPQFFDNFMGYRNGILAQNKLILHAIVAGKSKQVRGEKTLVAYALLPGNSISHIR